MNIFVLQVVILLFGSIALPILFGGFRLAINHPDAIFGPTAIETRRNYIFYSFVSLLLLPFHSALLQLKLHKIELMLRKSPRNKTLLLQKDRITCHQRNFSKVEIGLETIYQMVLINLVLFLSISKTSTYIDPVSLLEGESIEGTQSIFGIEIPAETVKEVFNNLGYISIGFSFISCVKSHLNVLSAEREYFPFMSKCVAGLYTMFAITKRVMAMILFFAPALGLFDLLHHWLNEQNKWHPQLCLLYTSPSPRDRG